MIRLPDPDFVVERANRPLKPRSFAILLTVSRSCIGLIGLSLLSASRTRRTGFSVMVMTFPFFPTVNQLLVVDSRLLGFRRCFLATSAKEGLWDCPDI
jgi:hypothetical protein